MFAESWKSQLRQNSATAEGMHCTDTTLLCQESKETAAKGMVQDRKGLSKERGCEDNQANYTVVKCRTLHLSALPLL